MFTWCVVDNVNEEEASERMKVKNLDGYTWDMGIKRPYSPLTKEKIDRDYIPFLTEMFVEKRGCRYIRWNKEDQAIINRLLELELMAI